MVAFFFFGGFVGGGRLTHGQSWNKAATRDVAAQVDRPKRQTTNCRVHQGPGSRLTTLKGVEPPLVTLCSVGAESTRLLGAALQNWRWDVGPLSTRGQLSSTDCQPSQLQFLNRRTCKRTVSRRSTPMDVIQRQRIEGFVSRMMASLCSSR